MCQNKIHTLPRCHKYLIFKVFLAIFLALIVVSSAFAFGGGGKSRKTSVYRGTGVDSIGVHFNGKGGDSGEESEETCPAEKQCGDYCCQGDNVCNKETGQCCSEALDYCCPANQGVYGVYLGEWEGACCEGMVYPTGDKYGNYTVYLCCPEGNTAYTFTSNSGKARGVCCSSETEPYCERRYDMSNKSECTNYSCYNLGTQKVTCVDEKDGICRRSQACSLDEEAYCDSRIEADAFVEKGTCLNSKCCSGTVSRGDAPGGADRCLQ